MGNIKAGIVRIYKIPTHKFFTKEENECYESKENRKVYLDGLIKKNKDIRFVSKEKLYKREIIPIFENDIVRLALKDRKEIKPNMQLLDEIIFVEVHHLEILKQIIEKGCNISDKEYIFFTATTGQQRKKTVVLIRLDFYLKYKRNITCGLDIKRINNSGGQNAGKYISYNALILSTSVPFKNKIDLDKCIVVKGLETFVDELVKYLDMDTMEVLKNYIHYVDKNGNKGIKIDHIDGAGMYLPSEQPKSFQVRGRYIKGAMFPFDFRRFALEIAHNTIIIDYKGVKHEIIKEDIRYIFTTSQFKNHTYYNSWDEYKQICKEENIELTVNSWASEPTNLVRWAYQFSQTFPYDSDITDLHNMVVGYLNKCKTNLDFALELVGLKFNPEKPNPLAEAISIYPNLVYDKKVMDKIKKKVSNERKKARISRFFVEGTYTYAMPDMYAFCEYLFMGKENPKGLVPKNQVYCKVYNDKDIENVCVLRSPHLSGYEFAKRKLVKSDACKDWFTGYDTVVSIHDLITKTLQMDVDGDELLITHQKEIWDLAEDKPPLFYEMAKADPIQITNEAIFDTLKKAFENCLVGFISNGESKLWNVDCKEKIDDDLICIETAYNNYSIDYPKTGINLQLEKYPEIWKKHLQYIGDFAHDIEPSVKKPYFLSGKKGKKICSANKRYYEPYNESIMNRIYTQIDKGVIQQFSYSCTDGEFDYHMLMNNEKSNDGKPKYKVRTDSEYYYELIKTLIKLKKVEKFLSSSIDTNDENDKEEKFSLFNYECVKSIKELFLKTCYCYDENLVVNAIIHVLYNQDTLSGYFPSILWVCYGHIVVNNICNNLNNGYIPVSSKRKAYNQAIIGNEDTNKEIDELLHKKPFVITKNEFEKINAMTKDNKATVQAKIIFSLLCMYKAMLMNSKRNAKDVWLRIYVHKQKRKQKGKKTNIVCHNFSEVDKLAYVSNGQTKEKMKIMSDNDFYNIKYKQYNYYEIQFKQDNSGEAFKILEYKNALPELYDFAGYTDKVVRTCAECNKKFLVDSKKDRTITCGEVCKNIRIQRQKGKRNMDNTNLEK